MSTTITEPVIEPSEITLDPDQLEESEVDLDKEPVCETVMHNGSAGFCRDDQGKRCDKPARWRVTLQCDLPGHRKSLLSCNKCSLKWVMYALLPMRCEKHNTTCRLLSVLPL